MLQDSTPISRSMLLDMVAQTKQKVDQRKLEVPLSGVLALAGMQRRTFDLSFALRYSEKTTLIAQIKRRGSSSAELENYDPIILAKRFETAGCSALMVTTNSRAYHGSLADLTLISQNVDIPVIRQDYVFDEYQVVEARAAGVDAVLLIAALLEHSSLYNLISIIQRNRMNAVVQVQNEEELKQAISCEPRIIAISNLNMHTFELDLETTARLRPLIPRHMAVISIGGLVDAAAVTQVCEAKIHGVVVGQEALITPETLLAIDDLFKPAP